MILVTTKELDEVSKNIVSNTCIEESQILLTSNPEEVDALSTATKDKIILVVMNDHALDKVSLRIVLGLLNKYEGLIYLVDLNDLTISSEIIYKENYFIKYGHKIKLQNDQFIKRIEKDYSGKYLAVIGNIDTEIDEIKLVVNKSCINSRIQVVATKEFVRAEKYLSSIGLI